jgi:hypothetical protein
VEVGVDKMVASLAAAVADVGAAMAEVMDLTDMTAAAAEDLAVMQDAW